MSVWWPVPSPPTSISAANIWEIWKEMGQKDCKNQKKACCENASPRHVREFTTMKSQQRGFLNKTPNSTSRHADTEWENLRVH